MRWHHILLFWVLFVLNVVLTGITACSPLYTSDQTDCTHSSEDRSIELPRFSIAPTTGRVVNRSAQHYVNVQDSIDSAWKPRLLLSSS